MHNYLLHFFLLSYIFSIAQVKMNIDFQHGHPSHYQEFVDTNTWDNNDRLYNVSYPRVYFYKAKTRTQKSRSSYAQEEDSSF